MRAHVLMLATVVAFTASAVAGCNSTKPEQSAASACADDGPTFPGTGICVGRSVNHMDQDALAALPPPRDGCAWAPQETMIGADEALLAMTATCNGAPTTLAFADGVVRYASGEMYVEGQEALITIFDSAEDDALSPLREKIAALPEAERKDCVIQSAGLDGALANAVVIGPTPAARAKAPTDVPNTFCGPFGVDEDSSKFWLVQYGKAMFFTLGQEQQDMDAASVTVLRKGEDGVWGALSKYTRGPLADCLLQVGGKTYLDGVCESDTQEDGSFQVFGKDYFAYASKLDDGKFNVSWNESPENSHAGALLGEDFVQDGACLVGAKAKVCRWDLGARK